MPDVELPAGRHVFAMNEIRSGSGGLIRAVLLRNRLFAERAGVQPTLLVLRPYPDYAERRAALVEEGLLPASTPVLSVFDHLRVAPPGVAPDDAPGLAPLPGTRAIEESYADGSPFRTVHRHRGTGDDAAWDYRRPDGTVHLRVVAGPIGATTDGGPRARLVAPDGRVVRTFRSMPAFHRHHLDQLFPAPGPVFVYLDSRVTVPLVLPAPAPRFHTVYVLHNQHTTRTRRWDSPMSASYRAALDRLPELGALVTLTDRQRDDVRLRFGEVSHVFAVPNPVLPVAVPEPRPARDPRRLVVVSRMAPQKNLGDALRAFRLVLDARPGSRLDVYGDGPERPVLEALLVELDLTAAVTLHGFRPLAEADLWRASGFLLTSRFEGYPLATLESLAHGCPVVAYDIRYGPREQISDGVDGYVVRSGDVAALAERAVRLLDDPALVARMSDAALQKAADHGPDRFLRDWQRALEGVVALAPRRTRLEEVRLDVTTLTLPVPSGRRRVSLARSGGRLRVVLGDHPVRFAGRLAVRGRGEGGSADLGDAVVTLTALGDVGGTHRRLPLQVTRERDGFTVELRSTTRQLFRGLGRRATRVRLRLDLVWENSSWQVLLGDGARWSRPTLRSPATLAVRRLQRARRRLRRLLRSRGPGPTPR
ncbi:poly(glycerol-phosphate) alpha-glucosyltransferase [Friedmanniella luteola]|uniref:Poly(Glycerol-phosphate) alpha-glucosyltransferase n=1 Tax=Friedmanniella luteola TaxID=546871 RepID=A0A1H1Z9T0_9ACTN|nr:glycosyltransferase [Friedmanniella luteola]SDT30359.1 poly(glycerol-phosphate) alpha-glucosyltransferase [Friedmanniella luteola]